MTDSGFFGYAGKAKINGHVIQDLELLTRRCDIRRKNPRDKNAGAKLTGIFLRHFLPRHRPKPQLANKLIKELLSVRFICQPDPLFFLQFPAGRLDFDGKKIGFVGHLA